MYMYTVRTTHRQACYHQLQFSAVPPVCSSHQCQPQTVSSWNPAALCVSLTSRVQNTTNIVSYQYLWVIPTIHSVSEIIHKQWSMRERDILPADNRSRLICLNIASHFWGWEERKFALSSTVFRICEIKTTHYMYLQNIIQLFISKIEIKEVCKEFELWNIIIAENQLVVSNKLAHQV